MAIYGVKYKKADELIGLKFKRIKYGMSDWTDVIQHVDIHLVYDHRFEEYTPTCYIRGTRHSYTLDEILIMDVDREYRNNVKKRIEKMKPIYEEIIKKAQSKNDNL